MTTNTLPHRLRTYLGGDLGNEAADEIERLTRENEAFWLKHNTTIEPQVLVMPTIEQIARKLERDGLTIVSAADAEKVKRCDCAWRPIESAPKDGTSVLLFTVDGVMEGYFSHGSWQNYVCGGPAEYFPTHWMPLPTPPNGGV